MQRTEKKNRGILCIAAITVSLALLTGIRYKNGADGKETSEILLDFPDVIRQQCQKMEEMRAGFQQEAARREEEKEEPEEIREASLVEQISDPTLRMYSWSTPGLVDPPYCSYAQEEGLDASEFGYMPEAGLGGEEAAEWGGDILYRLVLEPERIREYGAVLTKSSVEAWESFRWFYANPEDYYETVYTDLTLEQEDSYHFWSMVRLSVESWNRRGRYFELDRTFAEGVDRDWIAFIYSKEKEEVIDKLADGTYDTNVQVAINWIYERSTGLIQVTKMSPHVFYK